MNTPLRPYMTPWPVTIQQHESLVAAHRLMRRWNIRHLPVLEGERLVGIVSDGDLHILETLSDVDPNTDTVEDAMTDHPFTVSPDAPLAHVARAMALHRYGCAVVVEAGQVVGIFTAIDALNCLAELVGRLGGAL